MNIGIIGSGVYSLALMHALEVNNNQIKIWTHDINIENEFRTTNKLESVMDVFIGKNVEVTTDLSYTIQDNDIIFIVTTSNYFKSIINQMKEYYNGAHICIATKGLDDKTYEFLSNIASKELDTDKVSVISGPSFAIDIINNDIVNLTLGSKNNETIELVKKAICSDTMYLDITNDIIGIQLCSSIKNIAAITCGLLNGLGYSNSTNAFFITKVTNDLRKLILIFKGSENTILKSCGLGDMLLTCTSLKSRNYSFGVKLATEDISSIDLNNVTVEGYHALNSIFNLLNQYNINYYLVTLLYDIIHNKVDKKEIINYLIDKK